MITARFLLAAVMACSIDVQSIAQEFVYFADTGHWYRAMAVSPRVQWDEAQQQALNANGYLASITSAVEDDFVFALVNDPTLWRLVTNPNRMFGPWIGGFQPPGSSEPLGDWTWVSGEPWGFARWEVGEPNNFDGRQEDYLHYFATGTVRDRTFPNCEIVHGDMNGNGVINVGGIGPFVALLTGQ